MSEPTHPDPVLLERWRSRSLAPAEIVAVTRHLATCASCRAEAAPALSPDSLAQGLDRVLAEDRDSSTHLTGEQLAGWVDHTLDPVSEEIVASHLAICPRCRDEAADLTAFARTGAARHRRPHWRAWAAVGGSLAAALIVAWLALRPGPQAGPGTRPPDRASRPAPAAPAVSPIAIVLRDGPLLVDAAGAIRGVDTRWLPLVEAALHALELPLPPATAGLARGSGQQRSEETGVPPAVRRLSPRSRVLLSDRPSFAWQGPEAWVYRVEVYDARFAKIAASGPVHATTWVPPAPLPRGELLTWRLVAGDGAQERAYPTAPQLPAKFRIATAAEAAEVKDAGASGSHLVAGLTLWHAGLIEEAAAELALVAKANPEARAAQELAAASAHGAARLRPVS